MVKADGPIAETKGTFCAWKTREEGLRFGSLRTDLLFAQAQSQAAAWDKST
jgi:hypothetical protein